MIRALSVFLVLGIAGMASTFDYNGIPVSWTISQSDTDVQIDNHVSGGLRPTSIDAIVPGSSTTEFGVPYVVNANSHQKWVAFIQNVSASTMNSLGSAGYRIEDVEWVGTNRYTGLFTKYSENPVPTGWFHNKSSSQVSALLGSTRRLLELDSIVVNGVRSFTGVWVDNTGANAKGWGWMPSATIQSIMDWASQNNMRVIDLDPRGGGRYSAVFVKRRIGERFYVGIGSWAAVHELRESTGTRFQVLNKLEGQDWYGAILVNSCDSQTARVADSLINAAGGGRIGAYVKEVSSSTPIVNLRSTRVFYPASAIKVLIHAAGLAKVPVDQLDTYRIDDVYLSYAASKMMKESNNFWTYELNQHWGTAYINQYGRDRLGTTTSTWIATHYGDTPPDGNWNAEATLKDMVSIYEKRSVLGSARLAKFNAWMLTQANSSLYNSLSQSLANSLGLTSTQYSAWKSRLRYEYKAGNIGLNGSSTTNLHWVNVGRVTLPYKTSTSYSYRHFAFGHFVNDSQTGYPSNVTMSHSAGLVREQLIESLRTFK